MINIKLLSLFSSINYIPNSQWEVLLHKRTITNAYKMRISLLCSEWICAGRQQPSKAAHPIRGDLIKCFYLLIEKHIIKKGSMLALWIKIRINKTLNLWVLNWMIYTSSVRDLWWHVISPVTLWCYLTFHSIDIAKTLWLELLVPWHDSRQWNHCMRVL